MSLSPDLLAKLVCPVTRTPLDYDAEAEELVSHAAGLAFPVRGGVSVLILAEARPLSDEAGFSIPPH